MFAPFMPHIAEEIYQEHYRKFEGERALHLTSRAEPMFIDEKAIEEHQSIEFEVERGFLA